MAFVFRKHLNASRGLATNVQTKTNQKATYTVRSIPSHTVLR